MKKFKTILAIPLILVITLILIASGLQVFPAPIFAHNGNPHWVKTFIGPDGKEIDELMFPVKPPTVKEKPTKVPQPNIQLGINLVSSAVPAFDWSYGCSATSAAMLFGYYDLNSYSNMYTGPANGGNCPLNNSIWGHTAYASVTCGECPLSATHLAIDDRSNYGHVDDYWIDYGNADPDPYIASGSGQHAGDSAGDFMGTNQSYWHNSDASTTFYFYTNGDPLYDYSGSEASGYRDGGHGMKLFAESKGYGVTTTFNQYIRGQGTNPLRGFTFANYMAEIDAGRPVLIQVSGHTMLGYGYNTTGSVVYLHDTWDYADHTMTWGGKYAGMQHYGVTVLRLTAPVVPVAPTAAFSGSPTAGTAPLTVNFTNTSTGTAPLTYAWDFDNSGNIDSTAKDPTYLYSNPGTYTVKLLVTNTVDSDEETKTGYITVTNAVAPIAAFSGSPLSGTAPLSVNFTDQSSNSPTSWAWNFGDTATSSVQNPSRTYTTAGTYTVTLTATNAGGSDDEIKTAYITVTPAPAATISVTSPNGGEVWNKGANKNIVWSSSNLSGNIKIELSRNGGSTWTTIAASTANDGSYTWKVTRPATTSARIKISSVTNSSIFDISNANFTIR